MGLSCGFLFCSSLYKKHFHVTHWNASLLELGAVRDTYDKLTVIDDFGVKKIIVVIICMCS